MFVHSGLEMHFAEIENDLMALYIMLESPHSVEYRVQMEDWVQSLQDLGKVDITAGRLIWFYVQLRFWHLSIFKTRN